MRNFIVYRPLTGEILRNISAPDDSNVVIQPDVVAGAGFIEHPSQVDDEQYYVNLDTDPVIMPKGDYTLEALPLPCTVTIEGTEYAVTEQPTFAFNYPGTYLIKVDAGVQFLEKEFEIVWP